MKFECRSFIQTIEHLINLHPNIREYNTQFSHKEKERNAMTLPNKARNYKRVYWYLCTVRGIDPKIVSKLMSEKKIYQQEKYGNCVFLGYDEHQTPRYCSRRGTSPTKPYKGDQTNSNKSYPFAMEGTSNRLYVLESPIDLMSHASLCKLQNINYLQDHRISLGCLSDAALEWYLKQHPEIKQIIFAFDNDTNGKSPNGTPYNHGQEAAKKFATKYEDLCYDTAIQTPIAKDFNDDLIAFHASQVIKDTLHENEQIHEYELDS